MCICVTSQWRRAILSLGALAPPPKSKRQKFHKGDPYDFGQNSAILGPAPSKMLRFWGRPPQNSEASPPLSPAFGFLGEGQKSHILLPFQLRESASNISFCSEAAPYAFAMRHATELWSSVIEGYRSASPSYEPILSMFFIIFCPYCNPFWWYAGRTLRSLRTPDFQR